MGFVKTLEEAAENYRENAEFYDAEVLTVYFETKAEIVEKLLPPPTEAFANTSRSSFCCQLP